MLRSPGHPGWEVVGPALGAALAALSVVAPPSSAGGSTPEEAFRALGSAREVRVVLARLEERAATFASQRPSGYLDEVPVVDKRLDARWVPLLLDALGGAAAVRPASSAAAPCPADSASELEILRLRFGGGRGTDVRVWLDRGMAAVVEPRGPTETAFVFGGGSAGIVRLLRLALGDERLLAGQRLCDASVADSGAAPPPFILVEELPEIVWRTPPEYPEPARNSGVQGQVRVDALVSTSGVVERTRVSRSIPMLDAAAVRAVERWRFRPAKSGGRTTPVWVTIPVNFSLH